MKQTIIAVVWSFAALAAASCCRSNQCLRVIIADTFPGRNGVQDCSAYLAVTVTPTTQTVYEYVGATVQYETTQVETQALTVTETATAATESLFFTTVTVPTTAATATDLITAFSTVTATETATAASTFYITIVLKKRVDAVSSPAIPDYATAACTLCLAEAPTQLPGRLSLDSNHQEARARTEISKGSRMSRASCNYSRWMLKAMPSLHRRWNRLHSKDENPVGTTH
ncbi:uncharacterized protein PG986_011302 [Apiospora aurea]|uniref:Uncharacterized protein n=1 Tax=Apiospora aurea TaxID=335848 RepID=A0ABR1Q4P7_9PEZI